MSEIQGGRILTPIPYPQDHNAVRGYFVEDQVIPHDPHTDIYFICFPAYDVRVYEYRTDNNGRKLYRYCDAAEWRTTNTPVGIAASRELEFITYPNPVKAGTSTITLEFRSLQNERLSLRLLDMQGRNLQTFSQETIGPDGELKIQLQEIPVGLYLLHINTAKGSKAVKISVLD